MPARSASSEAIECPLCSGAGELTRAEVLDRLGVKDFARVAQLSAEEAFRLMEGVYTHNPVVGEMAPGLEVTRVQFCSVVPLNA